MPFFHVSRSDRREGQVRNHMTDQTPIDGLEPGKMLSKAVLLYETAADVFELVINEARDGDPKTAKEALGYAREFRQALLTVLNERATIEKLRKDSEGLGAERALDFERARVEIGRRLACLRDAGGD